MSDSNDLIECPKHGRRDATFVCCHLVGGEKRGFNLGYDPDKPHQLQPDAWCNECERMVEQEGEWNEKSEAFADIKILCAVCYEQSREKNWLQDEEAYHDLIRESFAYLSERQESMMKRYKVGEFDRWDWEQEQGHLIFSNDHTPQLRATIHFAGTYSKTSESWMWAWANESLLDRVKKKSEEIKVIGEEHNFLNLVAANWEATEVDGWEMTSVLAKHVGALGAYRTPSKNGFTYMVITKLEELRVESSF